MKFCGLPANDVRQQTQAQNCNPVATIVCQPANHASAPSHSGDILLASLHDQRRDGCYWNFATDISAVEGMSGSPVISAQGEVLGIVTLAGKGKFRGISFGASVQHSSDCLRAEGVTSAR